MAETKIKSIFDMEPDVAPEAASMRITKPVELCRMIVSVIGPVEGAVDYYDLKRTVPTHGSVRMFACAIRQPAGVVTAAPTRHLISLISSISVLSRAMPRTTATSIADLELREDRLTRGQGARRPPAKIRKGN
jgi:hypothetical protein